MMKTMLKTAAVIGVVAMMAGCANNAKIDQAMRKADSAQSAANQAQQTATQALQTAREAKKASTANSQRINRMFEASQRK